MDVIDKFQVLNNYKVHSNNEGGSFLNLMIHLLRDYVENGLYSNEETIVEINGEGDIIWEKTVNEGTVYLVEETPFYFDFYTEKRILNEVHIIRKLHGAIINEISNYLQPILSLFGIPEIILPAENIRDFGDVHYLEYLLEQELSRQFVTSKQLLLYDLLNYIRKANSYDSSENIEIYGTTSFNLVWEDICKKVYKDDLDNKLLDLGLKLKGTIQRDKKVEIDYRKVVLLKDIVERPIWRPTKSKSFLRLRSL